MSKESYMRELQFPREEEDDGSYRVRLNNEAKGSDLYNLSGLEQLINSRSTNEPIKLVFSIDPLTLIILIAAFAVIMKVLLK